MINPLDPRSWLGPGLTKPLLRRGGVDAEASFAQAR
jgi:hypothetical protein